MAHDDHGKEHAPFIAHHFDDEQQQFDAGKLGIWVFLVTEVLFFSGLFCAYVLYRYSQPEIFVEASEFLDKVLGGINTIVLLFSSLTMAVAVRAAQLNQRKVLIYNLMITMVCAAIFLGVKAVEYSHKWDEGILTRGYYNFHHPDHGEGLHISKYLYMLSVIPAILLVVFTAGGVVFKVTNEAKKSLFFFGLALMMGGYFLGAVGGKIYMEAKTKATAAAHEGDGHDESHDHSHDEKDGHGDDKGHASLESRWTPVVYRQEKTKQDGSKQDGSKQDKTKQDDSKSADDNKSKQPESAGKGSGEKSDDKKDESKKDDTKKDDAKADAGKESGAPGDTASVTEEERQRRVGIFFSIYYCMTGLHAIHVIAGMIALSWLLWRAIHGHFRPDYFGPVDYVGLYWHLVDLIWIYLFPLLYLIN